MDIETRMDLIKQVGEEIITEQELRELLQTKDHPIAYDGFEPSGIAHVPFGIYRAINIEDLLKAGVHFKLWVADWFGWLNNKMGGDLEKIKMVGKYFVEVWKASGIDMNKVEVLWTSDAISDPEYWKKVVLIAKNTTVNRTIRCLSIMGRKETELKETAQLFYPMMQTADIFHLEADICQLGLDQRRANMLAREVGPKLGWWKPVIVSHHMLMGLEGVKTPDGFDENKDIDIQISSKMSKSKPETCLYVHDTKEEIMKKINNAFCPEKIVENNPLLDYSKHIIFRKFDVMKVERPSKFGGNIEFENYQQLADAFRSGKLHPLDLKKSVAEHLEILIKPIREHFEKDKKAKELYELVKQQRITRDVSDEDRKRMASIVKFRTDKKVLTPSSQISPTRIHTALHVVKGAVQKVLGAKWTASVFELGNHGRLTVQFDRNPTEDEMSLIEQEANKKIQENQPIETIELDRKDAEKKFGSIIYDLFPIPEHITKVKIAHIKGWNINTCNKDHTKTTGEIGKVRLTKVRFRDNKKLLEISFDVLG